MTHALSLAPTRGGKWLRLRKSRRPSSMAQPLRGQAPVQTAKVYCDPRMPDNWAAVSD